MVLQLCHLGLDHLELCLVEVGVVDGRLALLGDLLDGLRHGIDLGLLELELLQLLLDIQQVDARLRRLHLLLEQPR